MDQSPQSPRYIQVYAAIRDWIYQGSYKPGQRLPTEGELCDLFGVSRITTRKAVDMLVDEELVVRQPGRGTFVVEDLADAPVIGDMEQLLRKVERLGKNTPHRPGGGPGAGGRRRDRARTCAWRRAPGCSAPPTCAC